MTGLQAAWQGAGRVMTTCRILVVLAGLLLTACAVSPDVFSDEREALAKDLGVQPDEYGPLFPQDYYADVLTAGTPIAEVHAAIQGYVKVLRCPSGAEVYYFYSTRDDLAVRFKVYYDDQFEYFIGLVAEDWSERGINVENCEPGQFADGATSRLSNLANMKDETELKNLVRLAFLGCGWNCSAAATE